MKLGGLQEISLLDYPEKISAIVWTTGCNFRCPFCYNKDMVFEETELLPIDHVFSFLEKRKHKLDALSITGGEPLIHEDLRDFIKQVKEMGFLVKVDTNGSFPLRLQSLLDDDLSDYVSMDVKAPLEKYDSVCDVHVDLKKIRQSIRIIMKHAPDYEFKTTMVPGLLEKNDVKKIACLIEGAKRFYLQKFKQDVPVIGKDLMKNVKQFSKNDFIEMKQLASPYVEHCDLRGVNGG